MLGRPHDFFATICGRLSVKKPLPLNILLTAQIITRIGVCWSLWPILIHYHVTPEQLWYVHNVVCLVVMSVLVVAAIGQTTLRKLNQ
jgi:hypothetical protein